MLTIPSVIHVGAHDITVNTRDNSWGKTASGESILGNWLALKNEINVVETGVDDIDLETFWHEALEAIVGTYHINLPHRDIDLISTSVARVHKDYNNAQHSNN